MKRNTVITVAALAASAGLAMADFDAAYVGLTGVDNSIHIDNTGTGGFVNQDFNAGHLEFAYSGAGDRGGDQFAGGSFNTFCIELQQITGGVHTYGVDSIENAPNPAPGAGGPAYDAADESEVHAVVAAAIRLGWITDDLTAGANVSNDRLAAIQGQIWKVVLDDAVVTGNGSVGTEMAALVAEIANDSTARVHRLRAMLNADTQDQLFIVPLPTAAFAGLMTLGGLAGFSRLRRR